LISASGSRFRGQRLNFLGSKERLPAGFSVVAFLQESTALRYNQLKHCCIHFGKKLKLKY